MKKTMLILALAIVTVVTAAQDMNENNEIRTLFSNNRSNGAYGAFTIGYSQIDGHDAIISGGRGAFIFDHSFAIGLAGYGFVNNINDDFYYNANRELSLAGGYGGLFFEPIIAGLSPVHLSFPILVGMGGVSQVDIYHPDYWGPSDPVRNYDYDVYFLLEPAVELEFNIARFFRTAAFASYRLTSNVQLYNIDENVLNGFNFGLTFKFGKF
ncbi:MAG: hypothetical protein JXR61_02900 [Prolixibacteraceae bacterium]|nr:hypothetical protein [Prolixibacteraceae bacterium]